MKVVLENLTKVFPSRNKKAGEEVVAVNNFSFEIPDGKLIGLLGPSGCGKSTTLYMISGLQKPTSGKIYFGDDDITALSPENRGVGLVFQNYALYPHMTVKQNILFPLQNLKGEDKLSKDDMLKKAYEAAKLVQIDELMDRKPSELSGGQQQRVAIARALVKMPRVLLLDEPLSNLDARLRLQTREEIRRIQRETQITTIFVTHDQEEAMSISDMIVVMKLGVIQQIGAPQDVYDSPENLFVAKFLGTPPINVFDGAIRDGKVYIGEDAVLDAPGVEDQEVYVGIRPEGFELAEDGALHCELRSVEVMGRDVSIVSANAQAHTPVIRSIINADNKVDATQKEVRFNLKAHKTFVFAKERVTWSMANEGKTLYTFNKASQTLNAKYDGKSYDLGVLLTDEDIAKLEKQAKQSLSPVAKFFIKQGKKLLGAAQAKVAPAVELVQSLIPEKPALTGEITYKLAMGKNKEGQTLYFAGGVDNARLCVTSDIQKAVDLHAELVTKVVGEGKKAKTVVEGYNVYYLDGETKVYPEITVANGENHEKRIFL
ncbi:MAG: ABC transporter ATP-binding protein [Clostridia bacterium]|nr:ABC transporter ATP-binding protein [Clostridia bacterium]